MFIWYGIVFALTGSDIDVSGEELELELEELLAPTPPKRTMRMYADDLEEDVTAKR